MNDEEVKAEYYRSNVDLGERTTLKERLIKRAISKYGMDYKYWNKMKVPNLMALINKK